jgi:hypothetical protein
VHAVRRCANLYSERYLKGVHVQRISELELSDHIVLGCRTCGERVVLLGRVDDWYSEGRRSFACECGTKLTLAERTGGRVSPSPGRGGGEDDLRHPGSLPTPGFLDK